MSKFLSIFILAVGMGAMGHMWWTNKQEVNRINEEFTEYRKKTDEKLKVLDSVQKDLLSIRSGYAQEQNSAVKDAVRGDVVAKKPKLVEKQVNASFDRLTKEFKEITQ